MPTTGRKEKEMREMKPCTWEVAGVIGARPRSYWAVAA
jgi:hypothetical protein